MQDKKTKPWRNARKLVIDNQNWWYSIGKSCVLILPPAGKKFTVDLAILTGRSWDTIGKGRDKRTSDGMIKPGHVRGYILGRKPKILPKQSF